MTNTAQSAPTASGPTASGPTASGPTASGPTASGPTASGPTASGPTASGPTASGPTASGPTASGPTSSAYARLHRSRTDRYIGGVCGGLAEHYGIDATLARVLAAVLAVLGHVVVVAVYLVLWAVMPAGPGPASTGPASSTPTAAPADGTGTDAEA